MNPATVSIHKTVGVEPGQVPVYILRMSVTDAVNVSPCIFVNKYQPGSKFTGPETYTFWNVAYLDEMTSISDVIGNRRVSCFVRTPCLEYRCTSEDDLQDFIDTVSSGVQRLLKSLKAVDSIESCSTISIGEDTIHEETCTDSVESCPDTNSTEESNQQTVSLSFTGE